MIKVKLIGSILIIGCCTILGLNATGRSKQRVKALTGLIASLELMKSEICTALTPLPELMARLGAELGEPAASLYRRCAALMGERRSRDFREAWRRAVAETDELCLLDEEEQALLELRLVLGRYDAEGQREALDKTQKRLELFLSLEEKERANKSRVSAALGAGAGITLALILL